MKKFQTITIALGLVLALGVFGLAACGDKNVVQVESVTLDQSAITLAMGGERTLVATVMPQDATDKAVSWSSSQPGVATVSDEGKVVGVSVGEAVITVTTHDGGKTATCTVTVTDAPVADARVHVASADALKNAVKADCEIVLDAGFDTKEVFTIDKTVIIDLNGKTIRNTADKSEDQVNYFFHVNGGSLTVKGSGNVETLWAYVFDVGSGDASNGKDGTLVIEGGKYSATGFSVVQVERGSATIKGGEFASKYTTLPGHESAHPQLLNGIDKNLSLVTITVTGGKFHNFDPAGSDAPGGAWDSVVPDGYYSKREQGADANDVVYTVTQYAQKEAASAEQLREAIGQDCVVKLTQNITLPANSEIKQFLVQSNVVLDLNGKNIVNQNEETLFYVGRGKLTVQGQGSVTSAGYVFNVGYVGAAGDGSDGYAGELVIKGGTYDSTGSASVLQVQKGRADVMGGTFSLSGDTQFNKQYLLNCIDNKDDASIRVTGGKFMQFNPADADNHDHGSAHTNYVQQGYRSTHSDEGGTDVWTVTKAAD